MGQYLYFNIATKMIVSKATPRGRTFSYEEIIYRMDQQFNCQLYDIDEDEEHVYFQLKDQITKDYLYSFLEDHMSYLPKDDYLPNIEKIKNKTTQEVIDYLKNEDIDYVYYNDYDFLRRTYLDNELRIYLEGIFYLSEGKIILESSEQLFKYLHSRLREPHHNPLEEATYLSII